MPSQLSEQAAARLAVQIVVTVVQFHHPRARALAEAVTARIEPLDDRREWARLISAWKVLWRELSAHMKEEDVVFDHVQFVAVRSRLVFGSMKDIRGSFEELMLEHDKLAVLRARLNDELTNTAPLHAESDETAGLRTALREFLTAHREHLDFENDALVPSLAPFLEG